MRRDRHALVGCNPFEHFHAVGEVIELITQFGVLRFELLGGLVFGFAGLAAPFVFQRIAVALRDARKVDALIDNRDKDLAR